MPRKAKITASGCSANARRAQMSRVRRADEMRKVRYMRTLSAESVWKYSEKSKKERTWREGASEGQGKRVCELGNEDEDEGMRMRECVPPSITSRRSANPPRDARAYFPSCSFRPSVRPSVRYARRQTMRCAGDQVHGSGFRRLGADPIRPARWARTKRQAPGGGGADVLAVTKSATHTPH